MRAYWQSVLKEVLNKNVPQSRFLFTNLAMYSAQPTANACSIDTRKKRRMKSMKFYYLGEEHGSVYFTQREAECMVLLLQGRKNSAIAILLQLSRRTVEYYIKNMKTKLNCRTKAELIQKVSVSKFRENVDFKIG